MPVIKSAIKKLRRDKKREKVNDDFREKLDKSIKDAKKKKTPSAVNTAVSLVDKAVKTHLLHKNRAARIKSSLSKLAHPGSAKSVKARPTAEKSSKLKVPKTKSVQAKKKSSK